MDCCETSDELLTSKKNEELRIHHKQAEDTRKQFRKDSIKPCTVSFDMQKNEATPPFANQESVSFAPAVAVLQRFQCDQNQHRAHALLDRKCC